jgi:hypothetical protein
MGHARTPRAVKYFASILFTDEKMLHRAFGELQYVVGKIQAKTVVSEFLHTDYYMREMSPGILRQFVLFQPHLERDFLAEIKLKTNTLEESLSVNGRRTVNIDPGYISLENVILATTKAYTHRIYLTKGIYADLTLIFQAGTFRPLEWTYPDYADEKIIALLNEWRSLYKEEMRC